MAGTSDYRQEQFIQQYEHITKLNLLTSEELNQVKRKRSFFESSMRNSTEIKNYINYIKYEIALMKKFSLIDHQKKSDERALEKAIKLHVMDLFRMTIKKFQEKRKIWDLYLSFAKQKSPYTVTSIYQEMLHFHHTAEDFIEAAQYEISKKNYLVALKLLEQGMAKNKDSCQNLVVAYIECSIKQGKTQDEKTQERHLLLASKFYDKFLKHSNDVSVHCDLLKKIENFKYSMNFQNEVITHLMQTVSGRADVWEILATRQLKGLVFNQADEVVARTDEDQKVEEKLPFDVRLRNAITIYEKSIDAVDGTEKEKMFSLYINKLLELDEARRISYSCQKVIRQSLGKALSRGYEENKLSENHFILFLKLRSLNMKKNQREIEAMLEKGRQIYASSLEDIVTNFDQN